MGAELTLYNDVVACKLVLGLSNKGNASLPPLYQGSTLNIKYCPITPTYTAVSPFYGLMSSLDSMTLEIGIGPRAGSESLYAYQSTWSVVDDDEQTPARYFSGTLNLNTAGLNSALSTADTVNSYLEIILNDNGNKRTVFQQGVRIYSTVIGPTGEVELPEISAEYYTKYEADTLFPKWTNDMAASYGKGIMLTSPDGSQKVLIWVDDDGALRQDIIT